MDKAARLLTDYVERKGVIGKKEREAYEYGFLIALEAVSGFAACIVLAAMLHMTWEGILFFLIFIPMRSFAGGLHLDRYWKCFLLSCAAFLLVLLIVKAMDIPMAASLALILLMMGCIYGMYPVEHQNRQVDKEENSYFRKQLIKYFVIDLGITLGCFLLGKEKALSLVAVTFGLIAVTMLAGKLRQKK